MSDRSFSSTWHRVAALKPRLRDHVQFHRHVYRGLVWYILQDRSSSRYHRFSDGVFHLLGLMDGERSVQHIWDAANAALGDEAPTQDEVIDLLGKLHAADVLVCDVQADTEALFARYQRQRRARWHSRLLSPLSLRFPLFDPQTRLDRWLPLVAPLFGRAAYLLWLLLVTAAAIIGLGHWPELTHDLSERVLNPHNLLILALTYPLVKALHELGHAFATRVWGGEVHEMGIMLLVLMPVPYVDASAASAFRDKHRRMAVGAAGIMVEALIAALAFFAWLNIEPGLARDIAYNIMLLGGLSTVLFNGNPLLRFDGYYVLCDAIEIPNLGGRAQQYWGYLVQRYVFGVREAKSPVLAGGERGWFLAYGLASFIYRLLISISIILFIAGKFLVAGLLLALWAAFGQLVLPLAKYLAFLFTSPVLNRQRRRAVVSVFGAFGALTALLFLVPVSSWTNAQGVIWLPEQGQVRAGSDGFIARLLAAEGAQVEAGDALFELNDPLLHAQVRLLEFQRDELQARYDAQLLGDRAQLNILKTQITQVQADLAQARQRVDDLVVRSPAAGIFIVPDARNLPGRFTRQGDTLAFITGPSTLIARAVVPQADAGRMREQIQSVAVKIPGRLAETFTGAIEREVPAASHELPSKALGARGGGPIPVDIQDPRGLTTLDGVFQFDITLPPQDHPPPVGSRVHLRFQHGAAPLAQQWLRALRQLLLRRFAV